MVALVPLVCRIRVTVMNMYFNEWMLMFGLTFDGYSKSSNEWKYLKEKRISK